MTEGLVIAGRYRLLTKLGEGGMGAVWRAEHLTLGTQVAVKLIDASIAKSEEALARFRREAQAAAELRSAHVVHILDYGVEDGTPYIAMELLDGESLAQRLDRVKKLTPLELANLFTQVGRALTRAHQQNIIHRDLKPDNIYLVQDGEDEIAKVLDFGIAKKLGLKSTSSGVKTQTGAMLGTPYYMSPEQARAQGSIDHRTDIWSLGIIAYECLTGIKPFDGDTLASLLISICTDQLPAPSSVAEVPPGFDAWFAKAASRDLAERFQTVSEAVSQLRQVCGVSGNRPFETAPGTETRPGLGSITNEFRKTGDPSALTIGTQKKKSGLTVAVAAVVVFALVGLGIAAARWLAAPNAAPSNASATPDATLAVAAKTSGPPAASTPATVGSAATPTVSASESTNGRPLANAAAVPSASALPAHVSTATVAKAPSNARVGASPAKANTPAKSGARKRDYDKSVGF